MADTPSHPQSPSSPPPPPSHPGQAYGPPYGPYPPRRSVWRRLGKMLLVMALVVSVLVNLILVAAVGMLSAGAAGLEQVTLRDGQADQKIAVYEVGGVINDEQAQTFHRFTRQVSDDPNVKAVVVRIESPGGSVSASDQIHHDILELMKGGRRKVVVSMGGVAASGGYYIAAPADEIYAEQTTVTGSIGVIAQVPVIAETLHKIGVDMVVIKSTQAEQWKDALSPFKQPTVEEIAYVRSLLDQMHRRFAKDVVLAGRTKAGMVEADLPDVANGQIWLGPDAIDKKLVDKLGYFDDAVDGTAKLAGLSKPKVVRYRRRQGLLDVLRAESPGVRIDGKLLDDVQTPRLLMLWRVQ